MIENQANYIRKKLINFSKDQIIFTEHAKLRMFIRQIDESEIIENILNPVRLEYAIKDKKGRYECYFGFSKTLCHRYILKIKNNLIVITVIKINRRWQRIADKKLRGKNHD